MFAGLVSGLFLCESLEKNYSGYSNLVVPCVFFFVFFFELGRGLNLLVLGNVRCCLSLPKDTKGSMTSMKIVPVPHEKRPCIPSNNKIIK